MKLKYVFRFKTVFLIIILIACNFSLAISTLNTSDEYYKSEDLELKKWTWLFYDDADFINGYDPLYDFAKEAYSSEKVDVLVLQDNSSSTTKLWYIGQDHNLSLLHDYGELNMGNYTTLRDLIEFGKNEYAAERYILTVYNHGAGWAGACIDETDEDILRMGEFKEALTETGGVDIICFTAPCTMGSLEAAYELRACVDIYIGSEEVSGYIYWFDVIEKIVEYMNEQPDVSNSEMGSKIIELIKTYITSSSIKILNQCKSHITMSAIHASKTNDLVNSFNNLSMNLINAADTKLGRVGIKFMRIFIQSFAYFQLPKERILVDVYDLAKKCFITFYINETIRSNAKEVMDNFNNAVIENLKGRVHPRANGLSIYFPRTKNYYLEMYTDLPLDFTDNAHWDEFLELYLGV